MRVSGTAHVIHRRGQVRLQMMRTTSTNSRCSHRAACVTLAVVLVLAGCKGPQIKGEREARAQVDAVQQTFRPQGSKPTLPTLTTNSPFEDYLKFALLNQPRVEAAYYDWVASVERITVQRSLPDPQLTFQMDVQDVVTSLMPGLMLAFPGAEKLRAAGAVAAADSQGKYFVFKSASLQSAYELKRSFYRLYFLNEKIRVERETLTLLSELEKLARDQNEVGKVTLQDVLRAQIEQDRLAAEVANLEDSRGPLLASFKAALGLRSDQPDPPLPFRLESTALDLNSDALLRTALERNTRLKEMEADVRLAEATIEQASRARMPDASIGLMADLKMSPILYRPWGTVTLPLWRDKLAAQIAEAQANKKAGEARLSAEQISLAVEFAQRAYSLREANRNLELLQDQLIPKQSQSLEVARSGYVAGQIDFFNLTDAEQTLLRFGLDEVEARAQRELALVELSLIVEGLPISGAPMTTTKIGVMGASVSGMGASGGMLPGGSAPAKKGDSSPMK